MKQALCKSRCYLGWYLGRYEFIEFNSSLFLFIAHVICEIQDVNLLMAVVGISSSTSYSAGTAAEQQLRINGGLQPLSAKTGGQAAKYYQEQRRSAVLTSRP